MNEMNQKPNVWLIMTDQQRWDTLGCYGNETIETVNLDYFAANGTVFENGYTSTPSCIPARASLLTGQDPWHVGILGMGAGQGPAQLLENTLPESLANAGYHTQCVGKMHVHPQRSLQGFHNILLDESSRVVDPHFESDYVKWFNQNRPAEVDRQAHGIDWNSWMARSWHLPEYLHPTAWTAAQSIEFLNRRDPTKPFFLKTSFARPHSPYDAPPYYFDLYNNQELPEPALGDWDAVHDVPRDATDPNAWHGKRKPAEIHRARAGYYGNIHFIDHQIGCVRRHLARNGDLNNTLIIFISDHGDMMGDHHLWRKTYAYEGSAHIPFIVSLPKNWGENVRERSDAPVCLQDVMPTILDACGAPIPETVDGRSVLPVMRGEIEKTREYVHGEHSASYSANNEMQYLTDGKWKYIWFPRTGQEQLFHLETDRYENHNLADDAQAGSTLKEWRSRLIEILQARDAGLVKNGQLVSQEGKPPLVSPHYARRIERMQEKTGVCA
jgi:choline-sulfatase